MSFLPEDLTASLDQNALMQRVRPPIVAGGLDYAQDPNTVLPPDYNFWERFGMGNGGEVGPTPRFTIGGSGGAGGGSSTGLAAVAALLHGFLQGQAQRGLLSAQKKNQLVLGQLHDIALNKQRTQDLADKASERAFELQKIDRQAQDTAANQALPADPQMNELAGKLLVTDQAKLYNMNRQLDQMDRAMRGFRTKGDQASVDRIQKDYDVVKAKRDQFMTEAGARADKSNLDKATKAGAFATAAGDVNPNNYNYEDDGRGGKFLDLSSFQGKAKEAARAAAVAAGAKPLDAAPSEALRQANQLESSYDWMEKNLDMLPPAGSAIPAGPFGAVSVRGTQNLLTQGTDPRVNQFLMYREPAMQSQRVFSGAGGKGLRFTKEIIQMGQKTNVPSMTDPQDVGAGKIANGRQLISIVRDTYLGKQKPPLSSFVRP